MSHAQPSVSHAVARVRAWLASNAEQKDQIAKDAGVNEKTIRLALSGKWNPTAETLGKIEALIPSDFGAPQKRRAS